MLEKIEKLRKAPEPIKQRVVAVVSIGAVVVLTFVWFGFSVPQFLKNFSGQKAAAAANAAVAATTSLAAPFTP